MSKGREAGGGAARRTLRVFAAPEVYAAFASEAPDSYQRLLAYASLEDPSQEPVVVLPDLSPDNALPVGTALTTQQLLLPYAIGLDPGCGYGCWVLKGALGRISPDILQDWVEQATWRPVGDEADWLIQVTFEGKTLGSTPVAPFAAVEPLAAAEQGTCPGALQRLTERVRQDLLGAFAGQVGALALGNHFIELHSMHVLDDNSGLGSSDVLLVIHNGSLDLGLQVQKYALRLAAGTSPITPERLPVLALPADKPSGAVYMTWLAWVTRFAAANRLVPDNNGGKVAMATAVLERGLMLRIPARYQNTARKLVELYRAHADGADPCLRDAVARAWMNAESYTLNTYWTVSRLMNGGNIGAEASLNKIVWSELDLHMHETALAILGPRAELQRGAPGAGAADVGDWLDGFLFALAGPIYAGTNEIQRNVIAERLLKLPKS